MVTVNNATDQERLWVHANSTEYAEFRSGYEVDIIFELEEDAKLEELLNLNS